MYHDVKHEPDCRGMRYTVADMRDCSCGKVIDCLLVEREQLQSSAAKDRTRIKTLEARIDTISSLMSEAKAVAQGRSEAI